MPLTDIQRIELACRRLAARERNKQPGQIINFTVIEIFEALADELAEPEHVADARELSPTTRCEHGILLGEPCARCGSTAQPFGIPK